MTIRPRQFLSLRTRLCLALVTTFLVAAGAWRYSVRATTQPRALSASDALRLPRPPLDSSGFIMQKTLLPSLKPDATLADLARVWNRPGLQVYQSLEKALENPALPSMGRLQSLLGQPIQLLAEGQIREAYAKLTALREQLERDDELGRIGLYATIYMQGLCSLRLGETENCIMCRGESSCILPISPAAVHANPQGSRQAVIHFSEYLERFPEDLEVRWLLNVAQMTLGEYPRQVDPRYLIPLERFVKSEFNIGRFRDIGAAAGVNRLNQAGGSIMDDFDGDGRLDVFATTMDPTTAAVLYRNDGNGKFVDCSAPAGLARQLGGLNCVQTDYDNDGNLDILILRGAWLMSPIRPSLLRNNGDGTFTDVTAAARIEVPVNSIAATWADYDNDGWLDLFICCEKQPNRLYRNRHDGTFEEVADRAGITGHDRGQFRCKGAAWLDYDNDGYADLFLNYLTDEGSLLFHNDRDGTFTEVTAQMNIDGPVLGFSCWAWDYDNDGWLDLFASSYDGDLGDVVLGLTRRPHQRESSRLYHNQQGGGFTNEAGPAGLDGVYLTMGSNFADFDNDGFLDMYLATGTPDLSALVPNRMFKNVAGQRFAEVTGSSGTGNLQKGHGVACGDWDCDGDVDLHVQMGGPTNGDKYHNILFQNPGQGNHWLTVKLVGQATNRSAIGARIKLTTAAPQPMSVHRQVSSGSSFGANALQQTIGLAQATRISELEIYWPASRTTQVLRDIRADQTIEVIEFAEHYRVVDSQPIPAAG